jgi:hypothetical protein
MEWLKRLLGDNYNKLSEEILTMLKTAFGEMEYIPNDPLKVIPKHVFNGKLEEIKKLNGDIESYKSQLDTTKGMVTTTEFKAKLLEQENTFKSQMIENDNNWKKQLSDSEKQSLLTNLLASNNAKYPDFFLSKTNLDDVVVKDGKILNGDDIIKPFKTSHPDLFTKVAGTTPNGGDPATPPKNKLEELKEQYNSALKSNSMYALPKLMQEIKDLEKLEGTK